MIRVVIADDHHLIRHGFTKLVADEPDISLVGTAASAADLLKLVSETRTDVVVLDISLPDRSGLEVIRELKHRDPRIRVLVLSMHPEDRYAKRAITDGASGYLTKDAAADELVVAIRRIYERGVYFSQAVAEQLADGIGMVNGDGVEHLPHTTLSDREYELLLLIGEGRTTRDAARHLCLSINTINSYRRRLMQKMNVRTNNELIRYVLKHKLSD